MDLRFEGMLTALQFLREKRFFEAHAAIAPEMLAHGKKHHFIHESEPVSWTNPERIEHRGYVTEIAAAIVAKRTGEDPGHVLALDPRAQEAITERAETITALDPEPRTLSDTWGGKIY
jgi:hypothetical protein